MSKRNRIPDGREGRGSERPPEGSSFLPPSFIGIATLAGVGVLIFLNLRASSETKGNLDQISTRVAQLGTRVDNYAKAAAAPAPRQGPDPNKVYTVKTEGSPMEGPPSAPITIAEFSDFQ